MVNLANCMVYLSSTRGFKKVKAYPPVDLLYLIVDPVLNTALLWLTYTLNIWSDSYNLM